MSYKYLSLKERLYRDRTKKDTSINAITKALGRSQGTISKDINRNQRYIGKRTMVSRTIEIHHKTIYRYIYEYKARSGNLHTQLRHYVKTYHI